MAINDITIPQCECLFNSGGISFTSVVEYDNPEDVELVKIDYYITSPQDDSEILFYTFSPLLIAKSDISSEISVVGDENTEIIADLVGFYGMSVYTIVAKLTVVDPDPEHGEREFVTQQQIQFSDVVTEVTVDSVASNDGIGEVNVSVPYWNNECMSLFLKLSKLGSSDDLVDFSFSFDNEKALWIGHAEFSTFVGSCNEPITLTIVGNYSNECPQLPCSPWSYEEVLTETVLGGCMNTNYPVGLHILYDQEYNDLSCSVVKTARSGHLVTSFTSIRNASNRSVYVRVLSSKGSLTAAMLVPDVTDNEQMDADLTPIDGTDDFVAVWSSNAINGAYRIYARRFNVGEDGRPVAVGASIQISQSNGNYFAPRIVYNNEIDKFFVTWISIADEAVQSVYLSNDSELKPAGYQGSHSNIVSLEYFTDSLDLHNSRVLSISLFNAGDKIIAAYKLSASSITILQYAFQPGAIPSPVTLPNYEVLGVTKFHFCYDEVEKMLKIVFVQGGDQHVYGDSIPYFARNQVKSTPIMLNQINQTCARPFITPTPIEDGKLNFVVGWETASYGTYYNVFDSNYSQLASEQEINPGVSSTVKSRIVVTDNQLAFVVEATHYGSEALTSVGLLYYVANK